MCIFLYHSFSRFQNCPHIFLHFYNLTSHKNQNSFHWNALHIKIQKMNIFLPHVFFHLENFLRTRCFYSAIIIVQNHWEDHQTKTPHIYTSKIYDKVFLFLVLVSSTVPPHTSIHRDLQIFPIHQHSLSKNILHSKTRLNSIISPFHEEFHLTIPHGKPSHLYWALGGWKDFQMVLREGFLR